MAKLLAKSILGLLGFLYIYVLFFALAEFLGASMLQAFFVVALALAMWALVAWSIAKLI